MSAAQRHVSLALVQMRCGVDRAENLHHAMELVRRARSQGAQIVCLPELFLSQYPCQSEDVDRFADAEPVPGPTTERLCALASELGAVIVASLFERRAAGLYHNTCAVIDADGKYLGKYRKMHVPDDPLYYEKFYFTPGDLGYRSFHTRFGCLGTLVCWDQWFPEAARLTAMRGAEILIYPTAIGWHPSERAAHGADQLDSWKTIQRSHAIANGCFVVAANRVGHEGLPDGGLDFWGNSFICDPSGEVIAEGPADDEAVVMGALDLSSIDDQRTAWPFFRDRRVDSYGAITEQFDDVAKQNWSDEV